MKKYKVIGLMSGTSLDGLDLCFCQLWKDTDKWKYKILATKSIAYDSDFKEKLKNSIYLSAEKLLIF
ncbi:MAG: anhydro-N-acetylmuramic acid kinase, partial [Eudoraea sp.]|nr:anhydro-N-acetylmuramic acid kinase [Eudoraea sp.]